MLQTPGLCEDTPKDYGARASHTQVYEEYLHWGLTYTYFRVFGAPATDGAATDGVS